MGSNKLVFDLNNNKTSNLSGKVTVHLSDFTENVYQLSGRI